MTNDSSREAALHEIITALRTSGGAVDLSAGDDAGSSIAAVQSAETSRECAICLVTQRSLERALRVFFSEFVNDPGVRVEFRKSRGFCTEHTPLLAAMGDALGVSILYADLADETQRRWLARQIDRKPGVFSRLGGSRPPAQTCAACAAEQEAETRYTTALAAALGHTGIYEALETGPALCVRHVEQVAAAAGREHAARFLDMQAARLASLFAELEEFVRKNDYRFRGEPWGRERDAWRRALDRLRRP